jgi:hypothetical protein
MLSETGNKGTREQGDKKTGERAARRLGFVQQQVVILSEVEGSVVVFDGVGGPKERTGSK